MQNSDLADRYDIAVENAFSALGDLPDDPEEVWSITRDITLTNSCRKYSRQKSRASPLAHDRDHNVDINRPEEGSTT